MRVQIIAAVVGVDTHPLSKAHSFKTCVSSMLIVYKPGIGYAGTTFLRLRAWPIFKPRSLLSLV